MEIRNRVCYGRLADSGLCTEPQDDGKDSAPDPDKILLIPDRPDPGADGRKEVIPLLPRPDPGRYVAKGAGVQVAGMSVEQTDGREDEGRMAAVPALHVVQEGELHARARKELPEECLLLSGQRPVPVPEDEIRGAEGYDFCVILMARSGALLKAKEDLLFGPKAVFPPSPRFSGCSRQGRDILRVRLPVSPESSPAAGFA